MMSGFKYTEQDFEAFWRSRDPNGAFRRSIEAAQAASYSAARAHWNSQEAWLDQTARENLPQAVYRAIKASPTNPLPYAARYVERHVLLKYRQQGSELTIEFWFKGNVVGRAVFKVEFSHGDK